MKSKIIFFTFILIVTLLIWDVKHNYTYSDASGAPSGATGSPADNKTCAQSSCHTGSLVTAIPGIITSNIPAAGYTPGNTYTIIATCSQMGISKWGFEISPQSANGMMLGMPVITNLLTTKITGTKYVTHMKAGNTGANTKTWSFDWIAPMMGTGVVTFYGAFNFANNDNAKTGDVIHTSTLTVSEAIATAVNDGIEKAINFNVYPNPITSLSQASIYMETPGSVHLSLLNANGQVVEEFCNEKNVNGSFIYNMNSISRLASGVYFVRLDTEAGTTLKRIAIL